MDEVTNPFSDLPVNAWCSLRMIPYTSVEEFLVMLDVGPPDWDYEFARVRRAYWARITKFNTKARS